MCEGIEEFVRPMGGRHSREARVRARFRRMRILFNIEFVLPVRLESRKVHTSHIYHIIFTFIRYVLRYVRGIFTY